LPYHVFSRAINYHDSNNVDHHHHQLQMGMPLLYSSVYAPLHTSGRPIINSLHHHFNPSSTDVDVDAEHGFFVDSAAATS
jgi:uncharacterized protein YfkK (UPF0435 family)